MEGYVWDRYRPYKIAEGYVQPQPCCGCKIVKDYVQPQHSCGCKIVKDYVWGRYRPHKIDVCTIDINIWTHTYLSTYTHIYHHHVKERSQEGIQARVQAGGR